MRKEYEMTEKQLDKLLDACKPTRVMKIGSYTPASPQENANNAWCNLGKELGFDGMTVQPTTKGDRFFTAEIDQQSKNEA